MRIIFMGTPQFAVPSLQILLDNGYEVAGVITSVDKLGGRGRKTLIQSPVKKEAERHGLTILQPRNLKNPSFQDELASLQADVQIVVAFRMLPVAVWDMPRLGTYNLHASLLPAYRGAAPINWAIMRGEEMTGLTTFKLKHEIDTGSLAFQESMAISRTDTAGSLHDRMMEAGAGLVLKTVQALESGTLTLREQDDGRVSHAPKIFHEDCKLDFTKSPFELYNFIRGLSPYPTAWCLMDDKKLKVFRASYTYECHSWSPGTFFTDGKKNLMISCQEGILYLKEIQYEGRKRMDAPSFLNGLDLTSSTIQILKPSE